MQGFNVQRHGPIGPLFTHPVRKPNRNQVRKVLEMHRNNLKESQNERILKAAKEIVRVLGDKNTKRNFNNVFRNTKSGNLSGPSGRLPPKSVRNNDNNQGSPNRKLTLSKLLRTTRAPNTQEVARHIAHSNGAKETLVRAYMSLHGPNHPSVSGLMSVSTANLAHVLPPKILGRAWHISSRNQRPSTAAGKMKVRKLNN